MSTQSPIDVLYAEDDDDDFQLTMKSLARDRLTFNLHRVVDGVEALAFLKQAPPFEGAPRPDIVLLDLNMPRKDGREVLSAIKTDPLLEAIPVVVLTTSDDEIDIAESYAQRANSYITKPVDLSQFRDCLATVQEYWFTVVKLPAGGAGREPAVAYQKRTPTPATPIHDAPCGESTATT